MNYLYWFNFNYEINQQQHWLVIFTHWLCFRQCNDSSPRYWSNYTLCILFVFRLSVLKLFTTTILLQYSSVLVVHYYIGTPFDLYASSLTDTTNFWDSYTWVLVNVQYLVHMYTANITWHADYIKYCRWEYLENQMDIDFLLYSVILPTSWSPVDDTHHCDNYPWMK